MQVSLILLMSMTIANLALAVSVKISVQRPPKAMQFISHKYESNLVRDLKLNLALHQ